MFTGTRFRSKEGVSLNYLDNLAEKLVLGWRQTIFKGYKPTGAKKRIRTMRIFKL